jgi:F-type H+-transporting ATPase subunit delta
MATALNNDIAHALYSTLKDKSLAEQSAIFPKIIQFFLRRRLMSQTPDILSRLDKIINESKGVIIAKISSKDKLYENTKREISHILKQKYSAEEIHLVESLDEKLLGGFKIEVNDEVLDLTVKNKIEQLQEYLTEIK